tara:strand:+ start:3302 stop:4273 length:972 start_codon:yes stop_codon:yes gene_type:complete
MAIQFGRNAFINVSSVKEGTYGDGSGTFNVWNRIFSCTLQRTQTREQVTHLSTSNGAFSKAQFAVMTEVSGTVEMPLYYAGCGPWIRYALGSSSTAGGSAPYTHTYTAGTIPLESFSLKFQRGTGGSEQFEGCMISNLTISCSAGEEARLSCDIIGENSAARGSSLPAPTFGGGGPVLHHQSNVNALRYTPSGGSLQNYSLKSFEFSLDNKLERRDKLGSLLTASPDVTDIREVTLSCTADMEDEAIYNHQLDGTSGEILVQFTSGTDEFVIRMYNAVVMEYSDEVTTVGRLERTFTFKGFADSSNEACKIEVVNDQPSAESN